MNTSATGGLLTPASSPAEDADLDALFQAAISGITGIDGAYVRPRWQPTPPKQPDVLVDWCALGVMVSTPDAGPFIRHVGTDDGHDDYQRHEEIEVLCSFYGPNCSQYAGIIRGGLQIPQNMETLNANLISFVDTGATQTLPELYNKQWIRRCDISLRFRRQVKRTYQVLNILSADPILISDDIGILTN